MVDEILTAPLVKEAAFAEIKVVALSFTVWLCVGQPNYDMCDPVELGLQYQFSRGLQSWQKRKKERKSWTI